MSMAIKYAMQKKAKKMAMGGMSHKSDCPGCEMCYADGGNVSPYEGNTVHPDVSRKEWGSGAKQGTSLTGEHVRGSARAKENGMNKASSSRMESAKSLHREVLSNLKNDKGDRQNLAEGGFVEDEEAQYDPTEMPMDKENMGAMDEDEDMISRIMHQRYSKGGMVANQDEEITGDMPAEYDDLHLRDTEDMTDSGAADGDDLGNKQLDMDDDDIVSRIMRSRNKKDRMPRPA